MAAAVAPVRPSGAVGPAWTHALAVASAAAVLVGTFLPWRETASGAADGWRTADLVVATSEALGEPALRVAALVFLAVPLAALGALACVLLRTGRAGAHLARVLSATALASALVLVALLSRHPVVAGARLGPAVVCAACFLLLLACWSLPSGATVPTTSEEPSL